MASADFAQRAATQQRTAEMAAKRARADALNSCLVGRGYQEFALTAEQAAELAKKPKGSNEYYEYLFKLGTDAEVVRQTESLDRELVRQSVGSYLRGDFDENTHVVGGSRPGSFCLCCQSRRNWPGARPAYPKSTTEPMSACALASRRCGTPAMARTPRVASTAKPLKTPQTRPPCIRHRRPRTPAAPGDAGGGSASDWRRVLGHGVRGLRAARGHAATSQEMAEKRVRAEALKSCLAERGYREFALTAQQRAHLATLQKGSTEYHEYLYKLGSDPAMRRQASRAPREIVSPESHRRRPSGGAAFAEWHRAVPEIGREQHQQSRSRARRSAPPRNRRCALPVLRT